MDEKLYLCNPIKNKNCTARDHCYLRKAQHRNLLDDCFMTKHKEYELTLKDIGVVEFMITEKEVKNGGKVSRKRHDKSSDDK